MVVDCLESKVESGLLVPSTFVIWFRRLRSLLVESGS